MFVNNVDNTQKTSAKTKKDKAASASFSGLLVQDAEAELDAKSLSQIFATNSLFVLQEVEDTISRNMPAVKKGYSALDLLDRIKLALLSGNPPPKVITELRDAINNIAADITDPKLHDIIDEIRLRAEVELAKYSVQVE